jgi:hypothetical protein
MALALAYSPGAGVGPKALAVAFFLAFEDQRR